MNKTIHITTADNEIILDNNETESSVEKEASNVAMAVIVIMAALVGIWGIACLYGGLAGAHGATDLARNWIGAVMGQ